MKPTDELVKEHDELREMFEVMNAMADRLERKQEVEPAHMTEVTDYLTTNVDKNHHAKEETLLFPAIKATGDPETAPLVDELLKEHDSSRELVRQMQQATPSDPFTFAQSAREFIKAVNEHMDKEQSKAFPLANRLLTDKQQDRLEQDFERVEHEVLGEGGEEQFKKSLKKLKQTYVAKRPSARKTSRKAVSAKAKRPTTHPRSRSRSRAVAAARTRIRRTRSR